MDSLLRTVFPFLVPALVSFAGCSGQPAMDPAATAKLRTQLTLADEPDGVQTVSEVRLALLGETAPNVVALLEAEHEHADEGAEGEEQVDGPDGIAATTAEADEHSHAEGDDHDHAAEADEHAHADGEEHGHEHADHDHADHDHAGHDHDHGDHDHAHEASGEVKEMDVVLVGVVGGIPNPSEQSYAEFPFAKGHAMFFLADPEAVAELEEHGHQHAPGEECAFCAAHAADATALIAAVQFSDENGKAYAVDARELFEIKEGETVVVRGKAKGQSGGILTVDATGLYVRR
jgi:hypothetical protein